MWLELLNARGQLVERERERIVVGWSIRESWVFKSPIFSNFRTFFQVQNFLSGSNFRTHNLSSFKNAKKSKNTLAMADDDFHFDLFSQLGDLHDGIDVNIPASTASFDASALADDASLVAPLPQQPGFTSQQQQQQTLPMPPVMAMPAQYIFGGGPSMSSQAALIHAQMQLRQMQSVAQQHQTSTSAGGPFASILSRSAQKAPCLQSCAAWTRCDHSERTRSLPVLRRQDHQLWRFHTWPQVQVPL
jgi:hypothetical protein